ncbi:hypothetical protein FN846DRAFT_534128 [Sphaerosporella brunnea]|uniref:Uncharacterized protein n=1 Tax=Sphaerosporella brunnea TaxID=1250544 RepID=A0A5J5F2X1_9PEZI|nr:hypothetical protein FN846DRAFT_534128 [Sphaerosporella brunnea]
MITAAAIHARPVPTLSVQPPDAPLSIGNTHSEPIIFTVAPYAERRDTPMPSTPGSPPAVISTATTPVVPASATNPQRNPFSASPCVGASTGGTKRTASGTVKPVAANSASVPSSPGTSTTPATPGRAARSQSVLDTSPRNVSQLSSQLKTRLTYALLKVQNNWTSESLEQVEARVSQGQHPSSPRTRVKRELSIGDEAAHDHSPRHYRTNSEPFAAQQPPNHSLSTSGRTYESFWREHEHNPITKKILQAKTASQTPRSNTRYIPHTGSQSSPRSGLQPPAQIIPDRDRRSHYNPMRQPPGLYQSISNQSNASTVSIVPNTPPTINTPDTQRTMEQDAVESLMFLSSPGHSQRRLSQSQSQSQLRELAEVAVEEPSSSQTSQSDRYSFSRNATTWPRSRRAYKQPRTGLGTLRTNDSGVGFDDDLTDEEVEEPYPGTPDKGKQKDGAPIDRKIHDGIREEDGDVMVVGPAS